MRNQKEKPTYRRKVALSVCRCVGNFQNKIISFFSRRNGWNLKVCTIHLGMLPKPYLYDFVVGEQRQPARESDIAIRRRRWAYAAPAAPNEPTSRK